MMNEELPSKDYDNKNEVVAAYNELLHKLKETKKTPEIEVSPFTEEEQQFVEEIAKIEPNDCAKNFDKLKFSINEALEDLREDFLSAQKKMTTLTRAIEIKTKELADIHSIEVNVASLSALLLAQKEKSAEFEQEMQMRKHHFEQEMMQKRREWQQEEQKYIYQRDFAREKDRSQYEIAKRTLEQELLTKRLEFQNEVKDRETRIAKTEHELNQLRQLQDQVAQFPTELQLAVKKTEENITQQLTLKFDYEAQLLQKEIKLYEQTISTLETKIAMLEANLAHFESLKNSFNRISFGGAQNA